MNLKKILSARLQAKKKQRGATILEYIIYSVLALGVLAGIAVFSVNANNKSNALALAKDMAGAQINIKGFYQGGGFGTGSLNSALNNAANVIPSDWTSSGSTITGQGSTTIVFTGATTTFTMSIAKLNQDTCQQLLAASSGSQWSSVTVSGTAAGTAITSWPITQAVASATTACGAANTTGLTAVFTSL
jgi:hypothetical protein